MKNAMQLNFLRARAFTGELRSLEKNALVRVETLEMRAADKEKLIAAIKSGDMSAMAQGFTATLMVIRKESKRTFEKGQSSWTWSGNICVQKVSPQQPIRFKATLKMVAPGLDDPDTLYVCEVTLPNVEFKLADVSNEELVDGTILYRDVPIAFYPGTYSARMFKRKQ